MNPPESSSSSSSSKNPTMAKLKLAGAFSGTLEVELENWTIPMLREEVAKRSDCEPKSINLICAGRVLKDGEGVEKLSQLGIKNNAKILVTKLDTDQGDSLKKELVAEAERYRLLDRIKAAAVALAGRHAEGTLPVEDYNIELEDQSGNSVNFGSETERRGVMMGLMLHTNAKHFIKKKMYKEALDVLVMGEESFSLCDPKFLDLVDNIPILHIDMVWCYFMLRDIKWLSMAGVRLAKAREGLERCHGKDFTRVRMLQGGCQPEIALHLRLELMEGVVAYHSEQFDKCRKALTSAQAKYIQLQISDETLSLILSMGYKENEAKRALRMNNRDAQRAVMFLVEEKEKKEQRREENLQRQQEIMEQKRYGMTPLKKAVNLERLNELVTIGFEKSLAAEALRRNENDTQRALDDLTNPDTNSTIQLDIDTRTKKRQKQIADASIEDLVALGFERSRVVAAVRSTSSHEEALDLLTAESELHPNDVDQGSVTSSDPGGSSRAFENAENIVDPSPINNVTDAGSSSVINNVVTRDVEMEDQIASEINAVDALSDYDIEVIEEGEAITEYLALLASSTEKQLECW